MPSTTARYCTLLHAGTVLPIENCSHGTFSGFQTCEITPLTRDFSVLSARISRIAQLTKHACLLRFSHALSSKGGHPDAQPILYRPSVPGRRHVRRPRSGT